MLTSLIFPSWASETNSDTARFLGGFPRPVLTAIQTSTTAQRMTIQNTAVFTLEFMNSPFGQPVSLRPSPDLCGDQITSVSLDLPSKESPLFKTSMPDHSIHAEV